MLTLYTFVTGVYDPDAGLSLSEDTEISNHSPEYSEEISSSSFLFAAMQTSGDEDFFHRLHEPNSGHYIVTRAVSILSRVMSW